MVYFIIGDMCMRTILQSKRTLFALIFIILGVLFIVLPTKMLYNFAMKTIGVLLIISSILKLVLVCKDTTSKREYIFDIVEGFIAMAIGVSVFKFYNYNVVTFICGIIYLIMPIIRIIVSKHKLNQLFVDTLKFIVVVILLSSFNKYLTTRYVISSLFFICAILFLISLIISIKEEMFLKENGEGYETKEDESNQSEETK